MTNKLTATALAVVALALNAPAAFADDPTFECRFRAFQVEGATGQNFEGVAAGFVVHAGDPTATIRCYIKVNGTVASSTPATSGVTAGRLIYQAGDTDLVTFHAEATTNHGTYTKDYATTNTPFPPQEVVDLMATVMCQRGIRGYPDGDPYDGDVYIGNFRSVDCYPYND